LIWSVKIIITNIVPQIFLEDQEEPEEQEEIEEQEENKVKI
jgi:hypothetical protein